MPIITNRNLDLEMAMHDTLSYSLITQKFICIIFRLQASSSDRNLSDVAIRLKLYLYISLLTYND